MLMSFVSCACSNAIQSSLRVRSLLDVVVMCGGIEMCCGMRAADEFVRRKRNAGMHGQ
jgi:hypothetical protein